MSLSFSFVKSLPALEFEKSKLSQKPCDFQEWEWDADSAEEDEEGPLKSFSTQNSTKPWKRA